MKINMDTLKALELKLAEYGKENGAIAEYESINVNCSNNCSGICKFNCDNYCKGTCKYVCADGPTTNVKH